MTGLRFFSTAKPSLIGGPVLPQCKEDAEFFRLRRERALQPAADRAAGLRPQPQAASRSSIPSAGRGK